MSGEQDRVDEALDPTEEEAVQSVDENSSDLESALAEERDRVLRLQAEMQNLRSRQARELADMRKYAGIELMREILPVLDNVDRAIEAGSKAPNAESLLEGFQLMRQQLAGALEKNGCIEMQAAGAMFDPDKHQAILQQPSADHPAGSIIAVTQAGFELHDRVVRAAQVIVSAGPAGASDEHPVA